MVLGEIEVPVSKGSHAGGSVSEFVSVNSGGFVEKTCLPKSENLADFTGTAEERLRTRRLLSIDDV